MLIVRRDTKQKNLRIALPPMETANFLLRKKLGERPEGARRDEAY
jgi:hypothetical protein